jgi:AcrR family transcriptional regulator
MDPRTESRDRILQAAAKRIKHYGYAKTTMAEIAADCGMSPGNIYRFFEAKIDIAEAMARQYELDQNTRLSAIARKRSVPADRRLREILLTRLRENFALVDQDAKILEVAEILRRERPSYHSEQLALQRVFLIEVLRDGIEDGLFRTTNVEFAAETIQAAMLRFSFPHLFGNVTLGKLEREFDGVMDLILNGLFGSGAGEPEPGYAANEQ